MLFCEVEKSTSYGLLLQIIDGELFTITVSLSQLKIVDDRLIEYNFFSSCGWGDKFLRRLLCSQDLM